MIETKEIQQVSNEGLKGFETNLNCLDYDYMRWLCSVIGDEDFHYPCSFPEDDHGKYALTALRHICLSFDVKFKSFRVMKECIRYNKANQFSKIYYRLFLGGLKKILI